MYDFEDIRPYYDHEVRAVVDSLLAGRDLSKALANFKFPRLYKALPKPAIALTEFFLSRELRGVQCVRDVQIVIEKYLDRLIETTTSGLTQAGLEQFSQHRPHLFISNHRDITLDPALVNYMLDHHGFDTVQIATGDNLMNNPFLADLMRLNKSFMVKRSLQGREKLKASRQLSAYIRHCIEQGENVWIAQREGRAKDGIDKTESAVITMLHMSGREAEPPLALHDSLNALNIVPVSISYEFDPCDEAKARELHAIDTQGKYEKEADSDARSILNGMVGYKGDVHVTFGKRITIGPAATAEGVARLIDDQIVANYRLHLVNYLAMEKLQADFMDFRELPAKFKVSDRQVADKRAFFERRLAAMPEALRPYVLAMYANPLIRRIEAAKTLAA